MFFSRCKFSHCMGFLLCRCYKYVCCFCSHVYPHKYNSIVITIPIVDGFLFYFSTSKFPSYFFTNSCWFKYIKYKFHSSDYQAEFNPRPLPVFLLLPLSLPRARAYIFLHPDLILFEFHRQSHGQYQASPLPSLVGRKQWWPCLLFSC